MITADLYAGIVSNAPHTEDSLYQTCAAQFGAALERLASAYEADEDLRLDLLQEIHTSLWRSFQVFDQRCSLRTWTFRVAHNTAASHVAASIRRRSRDWVSLEEVESLKGNENTEAVTAKRLVMERLMVLIQNLRPMDKQVILLYLEGLDAAAIAEVTGISSGSAATKIHRIKAILTRRFHERGTPEGATRYAAE